MIRTMCKETMVALAALLFGATIVISLVGAIWLVFAVLKALP